MTETQTLSDRKRVKKYGWVLFWICWTAYAIASMSKSAYSASMASMIAEGMFTKAYSGIINSGFYLFYGAAQLLGGKLIDRLPPSFLISFSVVSAGVCSLGMAFARGFVPMLIIWSLSGLLQFALWPSILRVIAEYLPKQQKKSATTLISFSYCAGMLLNYLGASFLLSFTHWSMLFITESVLLLIVLICWLLISRAALPLLKKNKDAENCAEKKAVDSENKTNATHIEGKSKSVLVTGGVLILLIPAFIRTFLDLGLKSWAPTIMIETYNVTPSFANALTTILVLFNLTGIFFSTWLYPKRIKNPVVGFGITFIVSFPMALLLLLTGKISIWVVIFLFTVITTMMYAGHQFINVLIPMFFAPYHKEGSVAGMINAIASFGSVVANFTLGFIADKAGWNGSLITCAALTAIAIVTCLAIAPTFSRFINSQKDMTESN